MRIRGVLAAVVVGAALMTAGCGRDLDDANVATTPGTGLSAEQQAAVRTSRSLTKDGSSAAVVMRFMQDLRDGAGPALLAAYDSRIPRRVGAGNMVGALDVMTTTAAGTQPVVTRSRRTGAGELVVVRLLRKEGSDSTYSFLLRPDGRHWKIVYDSFMVQGLQSYVASRESHNSGKSPSEAARAAARAVSDLQRATLYEPPRAGKTPAGGAGARSDR